MKDSNELETCLDLLRSFNYLGEKVMDDGAHLIGRAPHIAPLAWLHSIYPPLDDEELDVIERNVGMPVPASYKKFLKVTNGLTVFNGTFSLYGLRKRHTRAINDVWQPFDIWTPNVPERLLNATREMFFIGGYDWDGSHIYMNSSTGKVYFCAPGNATPLCEWRDFEAMLNAEIRRLITLFDKNGKELSRKKSTLPC